jgi:hypothetical protein
MVTEPAWLFYNENHMVAMYGYKGLFGMLPKLACPAKTLITYCILVFVWFVAKIYGARYKMIERVILLQYKLCCILDTMC